jgi:hypothetical protein
MHAVPLVIMIGLVIAAVVAFFVDDDIPARLYAFLGTTMFLLLCAGLMAEWSDHGRAMELCDQAGGVYSTWTSECTTPVEIIEIGSDE